MLIIKVSDNLQYEVGELQKNIKVSPDIPRIIITPSTEKEE